MTTGKTAAELAVLIMERVKGTSACAHLEGVAIGPADEPHQGSNWRVAAEARDGALMSADCSRAVIAAQVALQKDYHLVIG